MPNFFSLASSWRIYFFGSGSWSRSRQASINPVEMMVGAYASAETNLWVRRMFGAARCDARDGSCVMMIPRFRSCFWYCQQNMNGPSARMMYLFIVFNLWMIYPLLVTGDEKMHRRRRRKGRYCWCHLPGSLLFIGLGRSFITVRSLIGRPFLADHNPILIVFPPTAVHDSTHSLPLLFIQGNVRCHILQFCRC